MKVDVAAVILRPDYERMGQLPLSLEDLKNLARDYVVLRDENEAAHRALDDFSVPRVEPHFRGPYKLSGRVRWLRAQLQKNLNGGHVSAIQEDAPSG